jgi:hypothetical protein
MDLTELRKFDADARAERPLEAGCGFGDRSGRTSKPLQLAA